MATTGHILRLPDEEQTSVVLARYLCTYRWALFMTSKASSPVPSLHNLIQ